MSRADQWLYTLTVNDRPLGVWDKKEGGDADSEEVKYRPGGMVPQRSLGGAQTLENVTLTRLYEFARDHDLAKWMRTVRGKARCVIAMQPLDEDGNPFGAPDVARGTLKRVTSPEGDSEADDPGTYEVEITLEGDIA